MAIGQQLQQEQVQKLSLTPELVQAINILQLSSIELKSYIENELLSNPLLEVEEKIEDEKVLDRLSHRLSSYEAKDDDDYQPELSEGKTMSEALHEQLTFVKGLSLKSFEIGSYLINSLNSCGYLDESPEKISEDIKVPVKQVKKMLSVIQSFDPAGIGARSLSECLILQLKRKGLLDETMEAIVCDNLTEVAENKIREIAKKYGISPQKTQVYCDEIKKLNPKPGCCFFHDDNNAFILPDCSLEISDGEFIVTVNNCDIPNLCINSYYSNIRKEEGLDQKTLDYLEERLNAAKYLLKGVEKRRNAIRVVAKAIVERQENFFLSGKQGLKPLTLADVAYSTGLHISTISRTVNGKYIDTPRGLFELKYFFSGSSVSESGKGVATDNVKDYVKQIIDEEDKTKPLSDDRIKDIILEKHKVNIARRTVAKYREQLGIPGTSKRKRF